MAVVHLIDCGLGNLMSVSNALEALGCQVMKCSLPQELEGSQHIILPGVGAFGDGISKLKKNGLDKAIISAVNSGKSLLGICLGMQLLLDKSYEFGEHEGLHLIPGEVRKMEMEKHKLRLPHIGWSDTFIVKADPLFDGVVNPPCFYYVNSFSCFCRDHEDVLAEYEYGDKFCAVIRKNNVMGVQFHPEKSQKDGLNLLNRFINM